jgi:hypothetical protein
LALRGVGPESEAESVRFNVSSNYKGIRNAKFQKFATCCHRRGSSRPLEKRASTTSSAASDGRVPRLGTGPQGSGGCVLNFVGFEMKPDDKREISLDRARHPWENA